VQPLTAAFESAWGARAPDAGALEAALRDHIAEARRVFPELSLDDRHGVEALARSVPPGEDPVAALMHLRTHELLFACACAEGDARAIAVFDQRYLRPAGAALVRSGHDADAVDEALQVLRQRLLIGDFKIREFSGRGSLAGWVRVSVARLHTSLQRSKGKTVPLNDDVPVDLPTIDPELAAIRRRYGETFRTAFRDAFGALTPDQRNVLRLHFVDGLHLGGMAPILGVSRATAGRRVIEARNALLTNVLKLLGERLKASPSEIQSLLAVVQSTLHQSLGLLLRE
jgi:RNA polymerase sigma-70 factor (ECF subfamily)